MVVVVGGGLVVVVGGGLVVGVVVDGGFLVGGDVVLVVGGPVGTVVVGSDPEGTEVVVADVVVLDPRDCFEVDVLECF